MKDEACFAHQFADHKAELLMHPVLEGWEIAALENFVIIRNIRLTMGWFLALLGLNALARLLMMERASYQVRSAMQAELIGFCLIGLMAIITFLLPRWYTVLLTGLAVFPLALGIFTGLMAVALLAMVPTLISEGRKLFLTPGSYRLVKSRFVAYLTGDAPRDWVKLGKIGKFELRVSFFANAALFASGKNPLNILLREDANRCEFEKMEKGGYRIRRWVINRQASEGQASPTG